MATIDHAWTCILSARAGEIDRLADWAAHAGYAEVRDLLREAAYELRQEIDRRNRLMGGKGDR